MHQRHGLHIGLEQIKTANLRYGSVTSGRWSVAGTTAIRMTSVSRGESESSLPRRSVILNPMSRTLSQLPRRRQKFTLDEIQHIVLDDISWRFYEQVLDALQNRPIRVTYDGGRLEMMAPLAMHEDGKTFIGRMIETLTLELNVEVKSLGSTTYRDKEKLKGLEPDECYFFKNASKVRGIREWDSKKHPPPELVVEVDITTHWIDREAIYAALGVPEIWRWDGSKIECLHLNGDHYVIRKHSLAFPFLEPAELRRFLIKLKSKDENAVLREFIKWVRKQGWAKPSL
jgi:Uma2 family endonuclease